ncbi:putative phosphatase regulatory subunit, partial [Mrakia frigida]|uniref:CBM21 domain-containing protein n=1 Tax=Mrakia frigida TaxID=29902 RepID=UPI003FCC0350
SISLNDDAKNLRGIIHVRNIAFNKRVSVRFTTDSWSTTSEVTATFQDSIKGGTFDRFSFVIKLQDMARLEEKKLFLAVRYHVEGREIWDSNAGQNYHIEFKRNKAMKASEIREA